MPDDSDPPRKVYGFKEREFQRDNAPASANAPAPTTQDLAKLAGAPIFKVGAGPADRRTGTGNKADPNDVYAVLQHNRTKEQQHGADEIEIRKIRHRRRRDYFLLLVGGNVVIIGSVALARFNMISVLFGLAGVIVFSLGLTWVMWQVMGRY